MLELLYLAQAVSIAFYAIGFGEAISAIVGWEASWGPQVIAAAAVLFLFGFAWAGADVASRFQFVVMALLIAALVSFYIGAFDSFDGARAICSINSFRETTFFRGFVAVPKDWSSWFDPTLLHPELPLWMPFEIPQDFRYPPEVIREARRTVESVEGQERYLAACVLVRSAGQPGSLTEEEVRQWAANGTTMVR